MWIATYDPDRDAAMTSRGAVILPRESAVSDPFEASKEYGFGSAFSSAFLRENTIFSAAHELSGGDSKTVDELVSGGDPKANPYRFLSQNFDKETLEKLQPYIGKGEFESSVSDRMTKAIADEILYEIELQDQMGASMLGTFAGSALTSVLDPTSYIPFIGAGTKLGRAGRIGLTAFNVALSAGVSEAALQATQRARTLQESIMNVGTSAIIGGGLGVFGAAIHPRSPLNPANPNNPLRRENLSANGEFVRTVDGKLDEIGPKEIEELGSLANDSIGAARVEGTEVVVPRIARKDPKTLLGKAVRATGDFFNTKTIAGRVVRATSDSAKVIGMRLMDPGGVLLKAHLQGKALPLSAEAIKKDYMTEVDMLYATLFGNTSKLNMDLGKSAFYQRGKIAHQDVLQATQRVLYNMQDDALDARLSEKYGAENLPLIKKVAAQNAEEIHALNDVWEKRLLKEGLLQDSKVVNKLKTERDAARSEVEALTAALRTPDISPEEKAVVEAELKRQQDIRDNRHARLREELDKAEPLGRDYGHAQLWDKDMIIENPEDFRAFLMDALALKPDEQWLSDTYDMTPEDLAMLRETDREKYRSILTDWAGDEHYFNITKHETELKAVEARRKEAMLDLGETLRALGEAKKDEVNITLSEARTRRDKVAARLAETRKRVELLDREHRAFKEAATAARSQTLDAQRREGQTDLEIRRDRLVQTGARQEQNLKTAIEDTLTDPATPKDEAGNPRFMDAGDVVQLTDKVSATNQKIIDASTAVRQDIDNVSVQTARQQGRAEEVARQLGSETRKLKELEARAAELERKLQEVEDLHTEATSIRRQLTEDVRIARAERNIVETELRAVKRALKKARRSTPLEDTVARIHDNLTKTGSLPAGIMDRLGAESDRVTGRVKERVIVLDKDTRMEAMRRGWLQSDLSHILYHQYDQLAAEMGIREGVGIGNGRQFESWGEAMRFVEEEYNQMIADAADRKLKDRLKGEKRVIMDDLVAARDRLKGTADDDGTSHGWLKWASAKARQMNYIRYGAGFMLGSLTDVATFALRHSMKDIADFAGPAIKELRQLYRENPSEFQAIISSTELGMGAAASARRFGSEDLVDGQMGSYGIGTGRTRRVTGAIDKGGERISHIVSTFSGLPVWNRFWKTVAGLSMSRRLRDMTIGYDKLTPGQIADLASLGIGRSEAVKIADLVKRFGVMDEAGHFDPHLEKWTDEPAGQEAARLFRVAITRDMDRAVNTPGIGDTPRLMSKWHGKLLLQFQTFAFTFLNRYAYPVMQRASLFKDRQAYLSMGILLAAATVVMIGSDLRNGRDPSERFTPEKATETLHEIIDRSGVLGWTSPYVDSILKLTAPVTGYGGNQRYARNNALDSLLGINFALFNDVQRAAAAPFNQDPQLVNKILVLTPFSTWSRLFYNQVIDPQK